MAKRRNADGTITDIPQYEIDEMNAQRDAMVVEGQARRAELLAKFDATPTDVSTVPALRAEFDTFKQNVKEILFPELDD